jgi:hypothetical protein
MRRELTGSIHDLTAKYDRIKLLAKSEWPRLDEGTRVRVAFMFDGDNELEHFLETTLLQASQLNTALDELEERIGKRTQAHKELELDRSLPKIVW